MTTPDKDLLEALLKEIAEDEETLKTELMAFFTKLRIRSILKFTSTLLAPDLSLAEAKEYLLKEAKRHKTSLMDSDVVSIINALRWFREQSVGSAQEIRDRWALYTTDDGAALAMSAPATTTTTTSPTPPSTVAPKRDVTKPYQQVKPKEWGGVLSNIAMLKVWRQENIDNAGLVTPMLRQVFLDPVAFNVPSTTDPNHEEYVACRDFIWVVLKNRVKDGQCVAIVAEHSHFTGPNAGKYGDAIAVLRKFIDLENDSVCRDFRTNELMSKLYKKFNKNTYGPKRLPFLNAFQAKIDAVELHTGTQMDDHAKTTHLRSAIGHDAIYASHLKDACNWFRGQKKQDPSFREYMTELLASANEYDMHLNLASTTTTTGTPSTRTINRAEVPSDAADRLQQFREEFNLPELGTVNFRGRPFDKFDTTSEAYSALDHNGKRDARIKSDKSRITSCFNRLQREGYDCTTFLAELTSSFTGTPTPRD